MNARAADPIGVFDSGLGGMTVLKEIIALLPGESTIYFGDSGRMPYGSKSAETVIKYSRQNLRFLLSQRVKMVVIACNTASACAYETLCRETDVPVIEVVGPGAAAAVETSRSKRIGVIGTRSTIDSEVYVRAIRQRAAPGTEIIQQACPLFVGLAEEGWWDHPVTRLIAGEYLQPLNRFGIDTLVLGCTHYPLLEPALLAAVDRQVRLVGAGRKVAEQVRQTLQEKNMLRQSAQPAERRYFTSDSVGPFQKLGSTFLGQAIEDVRRIEIEAY
jgi:glutamate racemase